MIIRWNRDNFTAPNNHAMGLKQEKGIQCTFHFPAP